jgi:hypothetical protein
MIKPPGLPSQRKSGQPFPMNESRLHPIKALALERNGVAMMMVALAEAEAEAAVAVAVAVAEEEEAVTEEEEEAVVASNCSDPPKHLIFFSLAFTYSNANEIMFRV